MLGKGVPSEAVQTENQAVLADVLRAYGRTRNPDAVRIVVSFANSERAQVRDASRQSVALMGEIASWQLRDSYENVVGNSRRAALGLGSHRARVVPRVRSTTFPVASR